MMLKEMNRVTQLSTRPNNKTNLMGNIKQIKRLIFLIIIFICNSCSKSGAIKEALVGEYAIEKVYYRNHYLMHNFNLNFIEFYGNGVVKIPSVYKYNDTIETDINEAGNWKIEIKKKDVFLVIDSKNRYFNDTYKIHFEKDETQSIFILYLQSTNIKMKCIKSSFNYRDNSSLMDKAIEMTKNMGSVVSK